MKKQFHIIIIFLTLGFFMLPAISYGCGTKSVNDCCKKEITTKKEKKECCCDKSKEKKERCSGKCGHKNCISSSSNFSIISFYEIEIKNNTTDFSIGKSKFHHPKTNLSSGFYSIWLPPVIS